MLNHNGEFEISTGKSRKSTTWKNEKITWSALLSRVSKPHTTHETYAEYVAMSLDRQAEIKDIGGFVGGVINGGRRVKGSVLYRQLITLDVDSAGPDFWTNWKALFPGACAIYSTHKHRPDAPRLRLLVPLLREVDVTEYQAISRKLAGTAGIDQFDPTTFETSRLMFWPSVALDGKYVFRYQDGPWCDPDEILALYSDWKDSSQWPVHANVTARIEGGIKKQGDPLEKEGIVGAFCRTYSPIETAIDDLLADVYDPSFDGRYTFKGGTAANGLVLYDGKFCFSHHGSDPASGKLCNAWDIVRIHKFGDKDVKAEAGEKLPSQAAMELYAAKDPKVRRTLGIERAKAVEDDFGISFTNQEEANETDLLDTKWMERLDTDRRGNPFPSIENILLILSHDPKLRGCLGLNLFTKRYTVIHSLPWRELIGEYDSNYTDNDDANMRLYFESKYKIAHKTNLLDALEICFKQRGYHPVKNYLNALKWDGKPRASHLLIDYLGADDSEYVKQVTLKTLCGAVARIYKPGVKFDNVLILIGPQGCGKSTMINALGREWYSDSFGSIQNNKAFEQIQGVWILEMGELAGLKKAEIDEVKHFISKKVDSYRPAYGHRVEDFPRQCIFIGSTNEDMPLQDKTGGRRFWPVQVLTETPWLSVFDDLDPATVNQVWAEVMQIYSRGVTLHLSFEMEAEARIVQQAHTEEFLHAGAVQVFLDKLLPDNWPLMGLYERKSFLDSEADPDMISVGTIRRKEVCAFEIWCEVIGGTRKDYNRFHAREITYFLKSLRGWIHTGETKRFSIYGVQKYFKRVTV